MITRRTKIQLIVFISGAVIASFRGRFRQRYPDVSLHIAQESDADIVAKVKSGAVEFGFNSSTGAASEGLISLPAYRWQRVVLVRYRSRRDLLVNL